MESIVSVQGLCKEFVTPKKEPGLKGAVKSLFSSEKVVKRAVEDVSFEIAPGEIVGYIGSNGAGKSTTIKMMTGILVPTSGRCLVNGIEPYNHRKKNAMNIGVVFGQRTQLWWDLPLGDTFLVLKEIYNVSDEMYKARMEMLREVLDIGAFENSTVRTLSLGQRMRADLAAALLHNPSILYLDEPTIGLDILVKDKIRAAIREMNREQGTTVVLTTHDMADIEELCGHIIMIDKGRKVYDGTIPDLKNRFGGETVLELDLAENAAEQVPELLVKDSRLTAELREKTLYLSFSESVLPVPEAAALAMGVVPFRDMRIRHTEVADVLKRLYAGAEE